MADRWRDEDRYGRRNEERYASDDYYRGFYGASSRGPRYGYEDRGRDYGGYGGYGSRGYEDEHRSEDYRSGSDRGSYGRGDYDRGYGRENWRDRGYGREDYQGGGYGRYGRGGGPGYYGAGAGYYGGSGSGYGGYESSSYSGYGTGYGGYGAGYGGYRSYGRDDWDRGNDWGSGRDRDTRRGWWDRATDEVASWFGDEEADRRRREDERYYRAQHRGKGPRGYTRSDDRIREDVNDRLTDDIHIDASDIDVRVSGGEVTLSGTVTSRFAKRHAEDIAESVSGVKNVQNNIRVKEATTTWVGSGTSSASGTSTSGTTAASGTTSGTTGTGSSLYGSSGRA